MDDCRPGICHRRCSRSIETAKTTSVGTPASTSATATKPENWAIITYRKFLEEQDDTAGNIDILIREFISAFRNMRRNLPGSAPDVPEREGDAEAAHEALQVGKSEDAWLLLSTLGNDEGEGGVGTLPKNFLTKTFFLRAKTV